MCRTSSSGGDTCRVAQEFHDRRRRKTNWLLKISQKMQLYPQVVRIQKYREGSDPGDRFLGEWSTM